MDFTFYSTVWIGLLFNLIVTCFGSLNIYALDTEPVGYPVTGPNVCYPERFSDPCCPGWRQLFRHGPCVQAICDPACTGGVCVQPNVCLCRDGSTGPSCQNTQRSTQNGCKRSLLGRIEHAAVLTPDQCAFSQAGQQVTHRGEHDGPCSMETGCSNDDVHKVNSPSDGPPRRTTHHVTSDNVRDHRMVNNYDSQAPALNDDPGLRMTSRLGSDRQVAVNTPFHVDRSSNTATNTKRTRTHHGHRNSVSSLDGIQRTSAQGRELNSRQSHILRRNYLLRHPETYTSPLRLHPMFEVVEIPILMRNRHQNLGLSKTARQNKQESASFGNSHFSSSRSFDPHHRLSGHRLSRMRDRYSSYIVNPYDEMPPVFLRNPLGYSSHNRRNTGVLPKLFQSGNGGRNGLQSDQGYGKDSPLISAKPESNPSENEKVHSESDRNHRVHANTNSPTYVVNPLSMNQAPEKINSNNTPENTHFNREPEFPNAPPCVRGCDSLGLETIERPCIGDCGNTNENTNLHLALGRRDHGGCNRGRCGLLDRIQQAAKRRCSDGDCSPFKPRIRDRERNKCVWPFCDLNNPNHQPETVIEGPEECTGGDCNFDTNCGTNCAQNPDCIGVGCETNLPCDPLYEPCARTDDVGSPCGGGCGQGCDESDCGEETVVIDSPCPEGQILAEDGEYRICKDMDAFFNDIVN